MQRRAGESPTSARAPATRARRAAAGAQAFPAGTVPLRSVGIGEELFNAGGGTRAQKLAMTGQLREDFPQRRLVPVGDSGERDPEICAELARAHPGRIAAIMIRDVSGEPADGPRCAEAMRDVPRARWRLCAEPDDLPASGF